jgi:hypothetical protein
MITKEQLKDSILFFAKKYNLEESYKYLIETTTLPELSKMMIYEMFLNKFSFYHCDEDEYQHYKNILWYCEQLNEHGFVTFI